MNDRLAVVTGFDGSYVLGTVVMVHELIRRFGSEAVAISLKVAAPENDSEYKELFVNLMGHLGISFEMVELPMDETKRRRYNSPIALSKFHFLRTERNPFVWLDSDTIPTSPLHAKDFLRKSVDFLVVPRNGDSHNFNSGVFVALRTPFEIDLTSMPDSDFYMDQHILQEQIGPLAGHLSSGYNHLSIWGGDHMFNDEARIVHYIGEIKPWYISHVGKELCMKEDCEYAHWFRAEKLMLNKLRGAPELIASYFEIRNAAISEKRTIVSRFSKALMRIQSTESRFLIGVTKYLLGFFHLFTNKSMMLRLRRLHPFH